MNMKKLVIIFFITIYSTLTVNGQVLLSGKETSAEKENVSSSSSPKKVKEEAPEFLPCTYKVGRKNIDNPGGAEGVQQYLWDHIKYPKDALNNGIQGRVFVSFVVDIDGSVTDVEVKRSVHPLLDREAVRVISSMPKWKPGTQDGKPIRVRYTINVPFKTVN